MPQVSSFIVLKMVHYGTMMSQCSMLFYLWSTSECVYHVGHNH